MMTQKIGAMFWNPHSKELESVDVPLPTGLSPDLLAVRNACQEHCRKSNALGWAQQDTLKGSDKWLVYVMMGRTSNYVRVFPNREAAEMWLIHHFG